MIFDDLICTLEDLLPANERALAGKSEEEIINLYLTMAKKDLKLDLQRAIGLSLTDNTKLDDITAQHAENLRQALSARQLYYYYQSLGESENTLTGTKMRNYLQLYNNYKASFSKMEGDAISDVSSVRIYL